MAEFFTALICSLACGYVIGPRFSTRIRRQLRANRNLRNGCAPAGPPGSVHRDLHWPGRSGAGCSQPSSFPCAIEIAGPRAGEPGFLVGGHQRCNDPPALLLLQIRDAVTPFGAGCRGRAAQREFGELLRGERPDVRWESCVEAGAASREALQLGDPDGPGNPALMSFSRPVSRRYSIVRASATATELSRRRTEAGTCAPPSLTGTKVGAPSRVRLERANSTATEVLTSIRWMTTAASSAPGSSVIEPNAKIPTLIPQHRPSY